MRRRVGRPNGPTARTLEYIRLYNDGFGCNSIANTFGVRPTTVRQVLKNHGIKIRNNKDASILRYKKFPRGPVQEYIRLYNNEGFSSIQIAKMFGVSATNVRNVLKRRGYKIRSCGKLSTHEVCKFLSENGNNLNLAANHFGVSRTAIWKHKQKGLMQNG